MFSKARCAQPGSCAWTRTQRLPAKFQRKNRQRKSASIQPQIIVISSEPERKRRRIGGCPISRAFCEKWDPPPRESLPSLPHLYVIELINRRISSCLTYGEV